MYRTKANNKLQIRRTAPSFQSTGAIVPKDESAVNMPLLAHWDQTEGSFHSATLDLKPSDYQVSMMDWEHRIDDAGPATLVVEVPAAQRVFTEFKAAHGGRIFGRTYASRADAEPPLFRVLRIHYGPQTVQEYPGNRLGVIRHGDVQLHSRPKPPLSVAV